jgi:hypothetical protein
MNEHEGASIDLVRLGGDAWLSGDVASYERTEVRRIEAWCIERFMFVSRLAIVMGAKHDEPARCIHHGDDVEDEPQAVLRVLKVKGRLEIQLVVLGADGEQFEQLLTVEATVHDYGRCHAQSLGLADSLTMTRAAVERSDIAA